MQPLPAANCGRAKRQVHLHEVARELEVLHDDASFGTGRQCQTRRVSGAYLQLVLRQVRIGRTTQKCALGEGTPRNYLPAAGKAV